MWFERDFHKEDRRADILRPGTIDSALYVIRKTDAGCDLTSLARGAMDAIGIGAQTPRRSVQPTPRECQEPRAVGQRFTSLARPAKSYSSGSIIPRTVRPLGMSGTPLAAQRFTSRREGRETVTLGVQTARRQVARTSQIPFPLAVESRRDDVAPGLRNNSRAARLGRRTRTRFSAHPG